MCTDPFYCEELLMDDMHAGGPAALPDSFRSGIGSFLEALLPPEPIQGAHLRFLDTGELERLMLERPPFFFIEKAVAVDGKTVWARARMDEARSAGHFPGRPIVPLIELCKAMAQTGIILAGLQGDESKAPIAIGSGPSEALAKDLIDAPVTVLIKVQLMRQKFGRFFSIDGTAYVDGVPVGALPEIRYVLMDREQLLRKP